MIKTTKFNQICKNKDWQIKLNKLLMESDTEIITFSPNEIKKRIDKINKKREKINQLADEVEKETDKLLKELSGYDK